MKTIKIEVNEKIYDYIIFFLKNLPKNMVKIYEEKKNRGNGDEIKNIFKKSDLVAFQDIKDPVAWQQEIRDEWQ